MKNKTGLELFKEYLEKDRDKCLNLMKFRKEQIDKAGELIYEETLKNYDMPDDFIDKIKKEFHFWKRDKFSIWEIIRNLNLIIDLELKKRENKLSKEKAELSLAELALKRMMSDFFIEIDDCSQCPICNSCKRDMCQNTKKCESDIIKYYLRGIK